MKVTIQMVIDDHDESKTIEDIITFERQSLSAETVGLTLQEAKDITADIQEALVKQQVAGYITQQRSCPCCHKSRPIKTYHTVIYRTLFGKLNLKVPRLKECACQPSQKKTFSPVAKLLEDHIAPEFSYLQAKWASLVSYGATATMMNDLLPVNIERSSVYDTTVKVALKLENDVGEEKHMYIDGCQNEWDQLPKPKQPITVGIDGGFVHAREGDDRKAGWFEIIVGKSLQPDQLPKRFGFVTQFDKKPKRRLHDMLEKQGVQMNQTITFLSDGGDNVRDLQRFLSPNAEHLLDWFHITMRITVMKQVIKGFSNDKKQDYDDKVERIKWCLWHGNVYKALRKLESLLFDLDCFEETTHTKEHRLYELVDDFNTYITANQNFITNYSDRHHYGDIISTGFVESTVNECISRRMVKKQQMRWTQKGAHLLLQVRIKTLNDELRDHFCRWYPGMKPANESLLDKAA